MLVPTRNYSNPVYRYGFQGQEKDDEIKGIGNSINYKFRMHDPRVGRFFAVDPLTKKYPWNSPYAFSENAVISYIELEGLEKATPEMTQRAIISLLIFRDNGGKGKWKNILRKNYANALIKMVRNSNTINQSKTNLCGIAATMKVMIDYDPESFVDSAISLFESGEAESKSFFYGNIYANKDLFNKSPSQGLDSGSYVVMSSMRNYGNYISSYDPDTDTGIQGFTYPHDIPDILTNFANIKDVSSDYKQDINGLNRALNDGAAIVALFDIDRLKTGVPNSNFLQRNFGNHYVTINSITQSGNSITINYWNHGDTSKKQTTITTTKSNYEKSIKEYKIFNSD